MAGLLLTIASRDVSNYETFLFRDTIRPSLNSVKSLMLQIFVI